MMTSSVGTGAPRAAPSRTSVRMAPSACFTTGRPNFSAAFLPGSDLRRASMEGARRRWSDFGAFAVASAFAVARGLTAIDPSVAAERTAGPCPPGRSRVLQSQRPGDDQALDLAGPFDDAEHPDPPEDPFDRALGEQAH